MVDPMTDRVTRVLADPKVIEAFEWHYRGMTLTEDLVAAILSASLSVPPGETPQVDGVCDSYVEGEPLMCATCGKEQELHPGQCKHCGGHRTAPHGYSLRHGFTPCLVCSPSPVSDLARRVEGDRAEYCWDCDGTGHIEGFGPCRKCAGSGLSGKTIPSPDLARRVEEAREDLDRVIWALHREHRPEYRGALDLYHDSLVALTEARCRGEREDVKMLYGALASIGIYPPEGEGEPWIVTGGEPMGCPDGDTLSDALRWTCNHIGDGAERAAELLDRRAQSQEDEDNLEAERHTRNAALAIRKHFGLEAPLAVRLAAPPTEETR